MTKILMREITCCLDCPNHNAFLRAGECRCNKAEKVLDVPCQSAIPSWCPLPDKPESKGGKMTKELNYPEHNHPHGVENAQPNEYRIWVCTECLHMFNDNSIRKDADVGWGHACKMRPCRKGQRCESHLEPFTPDHHGGI